MKPGRSPEVETRDGVSHLGARPRVPPPGLRPIAGALAALFFAGGCVYYFSGSGNSAGGTALSFRWSFGDASSPETCAQAGVAVVEVIIDGTSEPLASCLDANGVPGTTIEGLATGTTLWELRGESQDGRVLFDAWGQTKLSGGGDTAVDVVLPPAASSGLFPLTFLWTFGGQSCAAAGVKAVSVQVVDSVRGADVDASVPCTDDGGVDGVTLQDFASGNYPYALSAYGADGGYHASGTAAIDGGPAVVSASLAP